MASYEVNYFITNIRVPQYMLVGMSIPTCAANRPHQHALMLEINHVIHLFCNKPYQHTHILQINT